MWKEGHKKCAPNPCLSKHNHRNQEERGLFDNFLEVINSLSTPD